MFERDRLARGVGIAVIIGVLSVAVSLLAQSFLPTVAAALLSACVLAGAAWLLVERVVAGRLRRQLAASERQLDATIEAGDAILWTTDAGDSIDTVSPGWLAYTGQSAEASLGQGWRSVVHADDRDDEAAAWRTALAAGTPCRVEYRLWHAPTSAWRWNSERVVPLRDADGVIESWLGMLIDVDDRRRAEESLRASDERYRQLLEQSSDGIWFLEFDPPVPLDLGEDELVERYLDGGRLLECNDAFARCYGYQRAEQMLGKSNADMLPRKDTANVAMAHELATSGFSIPLWQSDEIGVDGRRRVMESSLTGICRDGALVAEWGIQRDVTAERTARAELDAQRQRFRTVLDTVPVAVSVKDTRGRYEYMNHAALRLLGWEEDGFVGRTTLDLDDAAHARRIQTLDDRVLATGEPVHGHSDNRTVIAEGAGGADLLITKLPLRDVGGQITGVVTALLDVSELESVRNELSRSEQRWRRGFEAVPVAMEFYASNGDFLEGNPASYELFGTPSRDLPQVNMFNDLDTQVPEGTAKLGAQRTLRWDGWYDFGRLQSQGVDARGRSGRRYLSIRAAALDEAAGRPDGYMVISIDETERRRIEEAMQESEARYRRFLDNSHEVVLRIEFDPPVPLALPLQERAACYRASARLAECNDALAKQHGHADSDALMNWLDGDLTGLIDQDWAERFLAGDCRVRDGLMTTRHLDGSEVVLRVNAVGETVDGQLVREWGVGQDVTREMAIERERRQQQVLLTTVLETVPIGITVKDAQGVYTYVNGWMADVSGLTPEEMIGSSLQDLAIDTPNLEQILSVDRRVLESGRPAPEFRTQMVRASDGSRFDVVEWKAPILDEQQRSAGVVTSIMDVSQVEETRRVLEDERAMLQAILDTAPISVTLKDEEGRYRYVNNRAREVSGWGSRSVKGQTAADVDNPQYAADVLALDLKVLKTGEPALGVEVGGSDPDTGERFVLQLHKTPLRDSSGRITGLVSCTLDVSERRRVEHALESQRSLFASVLDALPMGVSLRDREREFRYVNRWWRERFGFDPGRQSGLTVEEITAVGDGVDMDTLDHDVLERELPVIDVEAHLYAGEGHEPSYGLVSKLPLRDADGVVEGIITCTVDISARRRAEQLLIESEQRYRLLYDDNPSMFFTIDARGELLQVNDFGARQLGYRPEQLVGTNIATLHEGEDRELMLRNIAACFAEPGRMHRWEVCRTRRDGEPLWVRETARTVTGSGGQLVVLTVCEDISEARSLSQELSWQASHDALTGLANRREFERRLALALESARGAGEKHTLCYLDLDQFKVINDTCGHVAGDELLRQLGALFHSRIRHKDMLARLGGDEFGLLMADCGLEAAERVCRGLRDSLEEFRFMWEGNSFRVGSSMGLVQMDATTGAVSELLGAADAACYAAKERGPNRIHVYRRDDAELVRRRGEMQWVSRIERALAENRLSLAYQHIRRLWGVDAGDHYELLLRMRDEEGKPVNPGDFLPAAERYGLATRLDRFVVKTAAEWLGANRVHLDRLFLCCINLSGKTLSAEDFAGYVSETFAASKVPLDRICFEITETAAIANLAHATRFIEDLHEQGCRFALDDFGSGLSSFAYLKRLPVDFLKIDGMFVRDIADDPIDLAMVRSISEIGHVMGKRTIAEFVESETVLQRLREIGVDYGQGYHLARPAPLAEMKPGEG